MASLVVSVLCVVLLSGCLGDAARPYRQFQEVTLPTIVPATYTMPTTTRPHCMYDGFMYPVGSSMPPLDPWAWACHCESHGDVQCIYAKSPRNCYTHPSPCVDAEDVYNPKTSCPSQTCPNGRNCRNPDGGSPIPDGQEVIVNGQQCYCLVAMLPSGLYNTDVLCPVISNRVD